MPWLEKFIQKFFFNKILFQANILQVAPIVLQSFFNFLYLQINGSWEFRGQFYTNFGHYFLRGLFIKI
jgi:hypothetical protein